jgi:hypothetical protein
MELFNFSASQAVAVMLVFTLMVPVYFATRNLVFNENSSYAWVVPLATSLFFVGIDFNANIFTGGNVRYAGTLLCLLLLLIINGSVSISMYSKMLQYLSLPLAVAAIFGSLYGRIYDGQLTGALPIAIPMALLLLRYPKVPAACDLKLGVRFIILFCAFITFEAVLVRLELLPSKSLLQFSHEKSFVMILGLLLSIAIRSKPLILLNLFLILFLFILYPAATLPVGLLVAYGTYFIANHLQHKLWKKVGLFLYITMVITSIFNSELIFKASKNYFSFVGKSNNSEYRKALIDAALLEIKDKPFFGTFFRGSATVQANVQGDRTYQLPVHNDYITLTMCGGVFFLLLFLIIPILLNLKTLNFLTIPSTESTLHRILIAFLAAMNVALVSCFANPVLMNPGNSTIFYCIIITIISLSYSEKINVKK